MKNINFEYYKVFYYVARYGSFTQAAKALYSNQPNVARVINLLEQELGCQLMIRTNRGIHLTEEGKKLYKRIWVAYEQIRLGEEELSEREKGQGVVVLGASEMALHLYLMEQMQQFHKLYPVIQMKVYNYSTPEAIRALESESADVIFVTAETSRNRNLERAGWQTRLLKTCSDVLIVGQDQRKLAESVHSLKDLQSYSMIQLGADTSSYHTYSQFYLKHGLMMHADIEVATADLILPMVEKNLGIGFLPLELTQTALQQKRVFQIPLQEEIPERGIYMIYKARKEENQARKKFLDMLNFSQKESGKI